MSPASLSSILPPPDTSPKGPRLRTPDTNAIPLLPGQHTAKYAAGYTLLIVTLFLLRFRSLVSDAYQTMLIDLVPLAFLQCTFCFLCLPAIGKWQNIIAFSSEGSGSGSEGARLGKIAAKGSLRKKNMASSKNATASAGLVGNVKPVVFALALTLLVPPIPLNIAAHVLGAPLHPTPLIWNTTLLSIHISLLTCLPLFYVHGVSGPAWRDIIAAWLPFDEAGVWGGNVGCLVGGWLGAIPMALDWDRDWQAWPVPVMVGCYSGWAVGKTLLGPVLFREQRIDMSVATDPNTEDDVVVVEETKKLQ